MKCLFKYLAIFVLLCSFVAPPAEATPQQKKTTAVPTNNPVIVYFTAFAANYGCPQLLSSDFSRPGMGLLKFIPKGQTAENATHMVIVTAMPVPTDPKKLVPFMDMVALKLAESYAASSKVLTKKDWRSPIGLPVMYLEHESGEGAKKEYYASVYARHMPTMSALTQVRSVGTPLDLTLKAKMLTFAKTMAIAK